MRVKINKKLPLMQILKNIRDNKHLSNQELADTLGISENHLSAAMNGSHFLSFDVLNRLCFELGMELTVRRIKYVPKNPRSKQPELATAGMQEAAAVGIRQPHINGKDSLKKRARA